MSGTSAAHRPVYNAAVPGADDLVRLHLSESPYGTSPRVAQAAHAEFGRLHRYPDPERETLVIALARHWGLFRDQVVVANGSDELVLACALALGARSRRGLVTSGTFPGYRACLDRVGRLGTAVPLDGTSMDVEAFTARLPEHGVGYVCNPHNPSGAALCRKQMDVLVDTAERSGVPLVFDEAYMEFTEPGTPQVHDYMERNPPVIALRTFSKAYGLAALRVGYAFGPAELIAELRETLRVLPFSVNRIAQVAAASALADQTFLQEVRRANRVQRVWLAEELARRGRGCLPSVTNFVAVEARQPALAQDRLATEYGILVRDVGLFGFPGYLRVSVGTRDELCQLLDALEKVDPLD